MKSVLWVLGNNIVHAIQHGVDATVLRNRSVWWPAPRKDPTDAKDRKDTTTTNPSNRLPDRSFEIYKRTH